MMTSGLSTETDTTAAKVAPSAELSTSADGPETTNEETTQNNSTAAKHSSSTNWWVKGLTTFTGTGPGSSKLVIRDTTSYPTEYSQQECSLSFALNDSNPGGHGNLKIRVLHGAKVLFTCREGFRQGYNPAKCDDGKWVPSRLQCEDINECETETSRHICDLRNALCLNIVGSFRCVCNSGFVEETKSGFCVPESRSSSGASVQSHRDKTIFCELEKDEYFDIEWNRTPAEDYTEWMPCPEALGMMKRYCDEHGNWAAPDTTLCTSSTMAELSHANAHEIVQNATINSTLLLDKLLDEFDGDRAIFGGDIIVAKEILAAIAACSQYEDENTTEKDLLQVIKLRSRFVVARFTLRAAMATTTG
ncbi:uncharacterized protein [Ptychodera flava]|uniref:uncharacterized protein n=1 Tax=Ptychodera flava TaxID=63121 RepID=UPI00396A3A6D